MENIIEFSKFEPTYSYTFKIRNKNLIDDKLFELVQTLNYLDIEYIE